MNHFRTYFMSATVLDNWDSINEKKIPALRELGITWRNRERERQRETERQRERG